MEPASTRWRTMTEQLRNNMAIFSPEYWKEFAPELTIGDTDRLRGLVASIQRPEEQREKTRRRMVREGYDHYVQPGLNSDRDKMVAVIERLHDRGYPPVFLFVYDEPWTIALEMQAELESIFGAQFLMLPDFWGWRVAPGQAGWTPHRDKGHMALFPDGTPKSLTLWSPLTISHPLNGCMYVLPADRDPKYGTEQERDWELAGPTSRALPGEAGDVFVWNQAVLHWGGHSADEHDLPPRMSVAFEFQRADVSPYNKPLLPSDQIGDFYLRLRLIAKQVMQYRHMYSYTPDLVGCALNIIQRIPL